MLRLAGYSLLLLENAAGFVAICLGFWAIIDGVAHNLGLSMIAAACGYTWWKTRQFQRSTEQRLLKERRVDDWAAFTGR